ncbi:MAG: glycosyltransferase [Thermodesulfobacteriota bacterium]
MEITPDLSLCLLYNSSPEQLRGFLASLNATADPVACEAIVVYRTATPPPAEIFRTFPTVLFFEEQDDATPAAAMNKALRLARGRYLSLWADSILLQPQTLYRLLTLLDDRPELGIIAPRLISSDGAVLANAGPLPSLFRRHPTDRLPTGQQLPVPAAWLSDRALVLRREVVDDIGFLDSGFRRGCADADLCRRASREGWRLALYPASVAMESAPATPPACSGGDLARFLLRKWLAIRSAP